MQRSAKDHQRLSALGKTLAVLEAVTDHPHGIGLPDLAASLGLPRQTVHRLLGQLQSSGLLLRDPARERFLVGPRLTRLSLAALGSNNRWAPVKSVMQELVDEVGETCNIGVLDGLDYVYVERIECEWPLRIHLEVGNRSPAHCLSGGKVLLAHLEPKACAPAAEPQARFQNVAHADAGGRHRGRTGSSADPGLRHERPGEF